MVSRELGERATGSQGISLPMFFLIFEFLKPEIYMTFLNRNKYIYFLLKKDNAIHTS